MWDAWKLTVSDYLWIPEGTFQNMIGIMTETQ